MKSIPRGSDTRSAVRSLAAAIRAMDQRLRELRSEVAALRRSHLRENCGIYSGAVCASYPACECGKMEQAMEEKISAQQRQL